MKFKAIPTVYAWSKAKVVPSTEGCWDVKVPLYTEEDGYQGDAVFPFGDGKKQAQDFIDRNLQFTMIPEPQENA